MANISSLISKIRTAIYGEEVRGSICDALNALNEDSGIKDLQNKMAAMEADIDFLSDQLSYQTNRILDLRKHAIMDSSWNPDNPDIS